MNLGKFLSSVSRRALPTCTSLYDLNQGYLTMGFAEADPRQLAPNMGKIHVGNTILVAPSSATGNSTTTSALDLSMARAESDLFGSLVFIAHHPILRLAFS